MAENIQIQLKLIDIKETSFRLKPAPQDVGEIVLGENLNIGFNFNLKIYQDKELLLLYSKVFYSIVGYKNPFVEIENEMQFLIHPISKVIQKRKDGELGITDHLMITVLGTTIGTIRGFIAANTKGTEWAKYPLPLLNPEHILKHFMKQDK